MNCRTAATRAPRDLGARVICSIMLAGQCIVTAATVTADLGEYIIVRPDVANCRLIVHPSTIRTSGTPRLDCDA